MSYMVYELIDVDPLWLGSDKTNGMHIAYTLQWRSRCNTDEIPKYPGFIATSPRSGITTETQNNSPTAASSGVR